MYRLNQQQPLRCRDCEIGAELQDVTLLNQ